LGIFQAFTKQGRKVSTDRKECNFNINIILLKEIGKSFIETIKAIEIQRFISM